MLVCYMTAFYYENFPLSTYLTFSTPKVLCFVTQRKLIALNNKGTIKSQIFFCLWVHKNCICLSHYLASKHMKMGLRT